MRIRKPKPDAADTYAQWSASMGIDAPKPEYEFAAPLRAWRFDFAWLDWKIAIERDGGAFVGGRHSRGAGMRADNDKLNEAQIRGWLVLRFLTSESLTPKALGILYRAFLSRGFKPSVKTKPVENADVSRDLDSLF
jgi:hypothetical protein